jgi:hypothetical protein
MKPAGLVKDSLADKKIVLGVRIGLAEPLQTPKGLRPKNYQLPETKTHSFLGVLISKTPSENVYDY